MNNEVLWSGLYFQEGHFVSFKVLEDNSVVIKEILQKNQNEHESEKVTDIDAALEYQKKLLKFGYEEIGGYL